MNQTITVSLINQIEDLAYDLLSKEWIVDGIVYNLRKLNWTFSFNYQKRILGNCNYSKKEISLSFPLIEANPDIVLWDDTMRHEIAHAIDCEVRGTSDHSDIWKNIGKQVGCNTDFLSASIKINQIFGKYIYKCNYCNDERPLHRKTKRDKACSICCTKHNSGQYTNKYKLSIIQIY